VPLWEEYNKVRRKSQVVWGCWSMGKCCGYKNGVKKKIEIDLMEALAFCFLLQRGEEN
jgi:hypothetical protein